jgi:hypothetical protein
MIIERNNQTNSQLTWDDIKSGDVIRCVSNDGCGTEFDAIYVDDDFRTQPIIIDISDTNNISWYDDLEFYNVINVYKNAKLTLE